MKNKRYHLTPSGANELETELNELLAKRPALVVELTRASELGDRSENAAYRVAKSALRRTDSRIATIRRILSTATIAQTVSNDCVVIGSHVTLRVNQGSEKTYHIVGDFESDPAGGKISYISPLGSLLMGKAVGSTCTLVTRSGTNVHYEVMAIS